MRRRASLATESADRRVNNLAENRGTESDSPIAGSNQTGLDVESRFTEGPIRGVLPTRRFLPALTKRSRPARGRAMHRPRRAECLCACCAEYPGGSVLPSRLFSEDDDGLRRYLGGSAPPSRLSGPAPASLALRPAHLPTHHLRGPMSLRLRHTGRPMHRSGSYRGKPTIPRVGLSPTASKPPFRGTPDNPASVTWV